MCRLFGLLAIAACALAPAACALAPAYDRPRAPVAASFAGASATTGPVAAELGWRDVFGDRRLQAILELALRENRDLRVAVLEVELARARYQIQRADLLPVVAGTARADVGGGGASPAPDGVAAQYRVGLAASYELDLFGRVRSLRDAALERYLATAEVRRAAHLALISEVVSQYLRVQALVEERAIAEAALATARESLELTSRLLEAGQRSELDVRTSEAQVHAERAEIARLDRAATQATNALVLLVGAPLSEALPAAQPLALQAMVADIGAGLPSELLQRRPDIAAAEHALRAANADIGVARAAFFPTISLTGFAGLTSTALATLFTAGAAAWSFTPQLSVPLFEGGARRADLEVARVRKRIEVARYERAIQVAFREVSDGLVARASLEAQLEAQGARAAAEQQRFEISQTRYRNGVESYLTVLAAQQALYGSRQQLVELRLARLINLADLYRALGGGWLERR
jgi:outer membrane protein, multidrug efflux system